MRVTPLVIAIIGCSGPRIVAPPDSRGELSAKTIVSLTFDDTLADQAQLGPMLAARGMHATFYVNSPRIGLDGRLTRDQLQDLVRAGNEIAGHTLTHPPLTTLDLDQQRTEVCDDRAALLAMGFAVTSFAYPFGDSNAMTEQLVASCGYASARGVGDLINPGTCDQCAAANPMPPLDAFDLKTHASIKIDTTLDTLEGYVTDAEVSGGWVPLVFHHVCDGCSPLSISPQTLASFLDWLAARAGTGTVVETVSDVIAGPLR